MARERRPQHSRPEHRVCSAADMRYARSFFQLQLEFAETVSGLSGLPFTHALLEYTNFYIRFGLGRDFDSNHPGWQEYLAGLQAEDPGEWTYRFYLSQPDAVVPPGLVATFGCFSYAQSSSDSIRLHFHVAEPDGQSPLAMECREQRLAELAALFAHVKRTRPGPLRVLGASWLYNLEAYRRLFPEPYLASARALHDRFRHMPLWGQFVDRRGEVRESPARRFRDHLGRQSSLDGLGRCFPLQVLASAASVLDFYDFHGV